MMPAASPSGDGSSCRRIRSAATAERGRISMDDTSSGSPQNEVASADRVAFLRSASNVGHPNLPRDDPSTGVCASDSTPELERELDVLPEQVRRRDPCNVRDGQPQTVLIEHRGMGRDPARRTPSGNRHCASVSAFCPKCQASRTGQPGGVKNNHWPHIGAALLPLPDSPSKRWRAGDGVGMRRQRVATAPASPGRGR